MAVLLFYISGYSLQDIAIFLEVPVTTVKKRLQYARQRLKERMLEVAHDDLQARRPSNDEGFVRTVQFLTALDAMAAEHRLAVEDLLQHDGLAEPELDADGEEILAWAAQRGHVDVVDLLLHDGVDPNARDADGRTLLSCAAQRGDLDLAALLLRFGVDANTRDTSGKTPLQWAVEHGYQEIVALLREHGGSAPPR